MILLLTGIVIGFLLASIWEYVIEMYDLYREERERERE